MMGRLNPLEPLAMTSIYDQHLDRNPANFVALSR